MLKSRRRIGWFLLLALAVGCSLRLVNLLRPRLLLDQSTRIASLGHEEWSNCFWLSDHQALLVGPVAPFQNSEVVQVDVDKQTATPAQTLPPDIRLRLSDALSAVSPDGKWLVWSEWQQNNFFHIAATLDGKRWLQWLVKCRDVLMGPPYWMRDSRHFVELYGGPSSPPGPLIIPQYALLYSLTDTQDVQKIQLPGLSANDLPIGITSQGVILFPVGTLLWPGGAPPDTPLRHMTYLEYVLAAPIATIHKAKLPLPDSIGIYDLAFSPRGDRLAQVLERREKASGPSFWKRLLALLGQPPRTRLELWVMPLRGGAMQLIGTLYPDMREKRAPSVLWTDRWPSMLRWLPDGKHLSFVYKDALWTVPVD